MKKRIFSALLAAILMLSLASCEREAEDKKKTFYYGEGGYLNAGYATLYDYTGSPKEDFDALCEEFEQELFRYHRLFDIYNEYGGITNLKTVNRTAGEGAIRVDPEICELLLFSKEMYERTDGAVNIAMGSVLSLWHEAREAASDKENPVFYLPGEEALRSAAEHTSIENIVVDSAASTVEILDKETKIDVGAVAKGFVCEKLCRMLKSKGLSGYAIDIGGNIRVVGARPDGSPLPGRIRGSDKVYELSDSSLVTSGVYNRFYTVDGVDYHHIINPDTLMPERRYWSVSVHTESSAVADALSTAFFNMTEEEIESVLVRFADTELTVIYPDGGIREFK